MTVFGAEELLDFTHVDDCVDGIMLGIERLMDGLVRNETINLASGIGSSLLTMASHIGLPWANSRASRLNVPGPEKSHDTSPLLIEPARC